MTLELRLPQHLFRGLNQLIRFVTKPLLQLLQRSGSSKSLHAIKFSGRRHIALPSKARRLLDSDARFHMGWQHAVAILTRLMLELRDEKNIASIAVLDHQR